MIIMEGLKMIIGVPKEIKPNEYRVAAIPTVAMELTRRGHEVYVERGAGLGSGFSDQDYKDCGAQIVDKDTAYGKADLIYKVKEIFPEEYKYMKEDKILFTYIHSNAHREMTEELLKSNILSIAYEDVIDSKGKFPLLKPMSELAGKGGFLAALHFSQTVNGGPGKLLHNVCGVEPPTITIIGAGSSGFGAAELAASFGNNVRILDVNMAAMEEAKKELPNNVSFMISNRANLVKCLKETDVLINCILWDKTRTDHLVSREDLKLMKRNAMIIDVACDDGGAIQTCRSTTHDNPIYREEGIIHYAVDNIPSAFAQTASTTLSNATIPYVIEIADKGVKKALKENAGLRRGLTTYLGQLTLEETALKFGKEFVSPDTIVENF